MRVFYLSIYLFYFIQPSGLSASHFHTLLVSRPVNNSETFSQAASRQLVSFLAFYVVFCQMKELISEKCGIRHRKCIRAIFTHELVMCKGSE